ncbi:MAG TPA: spermidine/putrescine ABC transporter substrate-binding protein [Actinomycetota bacterium]|nr:spermidine/putrescine ABC transporter substrate-binding protein [Actinomycetota bacterium]
MTERERALGRPMSRRELLRTAGRGSMYLGAMAFLAACGVQAERRPRQRLEELPPESGELNMANWPLYIDKSGGRSPTLISFREETGIDISYKTVINDNEEFFGTIREPLSQGEPTGWDIIVVTDWLVAKMIDLGYAERLHHDRLPTATENLADKFRDPWYDPGNAHSFPWAAGITGIGYDISATGREITSVQDLLDPEFEGRVGMFSEMRDTFGLVLLSLGVEPQDATVEDVEKAQQLLIDNRGNFRDFYGNEYTDQLGAGNLALSMAWSGDIFALSLDNPDLRFVIPEEGGMAWTDNMVIPAGAENPTDAHAFIDYVYQPRIATNITEWVWYESPVDGVQELVQEDIAGGGPRYLRELAESELVFPTEDTLAQLHPYKRLDLEEEEVWNDLFQEVVQG